MLDYVVIYDVGLPILPTLYHNIPTFATYRPTPPRFQILPVLCKLYPKLALKMCKISENSLKKCGIYKNIILKLQFNA